MSLEPVPFLQFSGDFFPLYSLKVQTVNSSLSSDQLTKQTSLLTFRMQFYPLTWEVLRNARATFSPPGHQAPAVAARPACFSP